MKEPKVSIELLKRIVYGDEEADPEMESFLKETSGGTLKPLPNLADFSPYAVSVHINKEYGLKTTQEEIEGFYRQIEEISDKPLSQREKAEAVAEVVALTENFQKQILECGLFITKTIEDAASF